ncbi:hypothetical protein PV327_009808 [Microctonus hyperodae]|uniref:BTB domain-containing protein n=1 Tax=Microctonus hyperodae TaxID=165561 RepID=A0AA39F1R3_MICHY|nr:hypothetical protein PV327_009808 [Microctonus hyperodae]
MSVMSNKNINSNTDSVPTESIDFKELFNDKTSTDVTFIFVGGIIKAHKVALMARSPVFKEMFTQKMANQQNNEIKISDIDIEVFEEILKYIYTDNISSLDKNHVTKLLPAACKYKLDALKQMCGESIWKEITVENASRTLVMANTYKMAQLQIRTLHFICEHFDEITKALSYERMKNRHPKIAMMIEIFKQMKGGKRKLVIYLMERRVAFE